MNQDLFAFEEPDDAITMPKVYSWQWHDAWPADLSVREQHLRQIRRDLRTMEENLDNPDRECYEGRIALHRRALYDME